MKLKFISLAILLPICSQAQSASFDCTKAGTDTEKMICNNAELSRLDSELLPIYQQARRVTNNSANFKANGRNAIKWRNQNCTTVSCLSNWYRNRKIELDNIIDSRYVPSPSCLVENRHTELKGVIKKETFNHWDTGSPMVYWILHTNQPICTYEVELGDNRYTQLQNQSEFQLVISDYSRYKKYVNKEVIVHGIPYSSHTAYHIKDMLITVENIEE